MASNMMQEIEKAIDKLSAEELSQLYSWLDEHHPQPIDVRLNSDLANGHLDKAIFRGLNDENSGQTQPI